MLFPIAGAWYQNLRLGVLPTDNMINSYLAVGMETG